MIPHVEVKSTPANCGECGQDHLTQEQHDIIRIATSFQGEDLIISAYAGCGKTFILDKIACANYRRRGVYFAFNSAIAKEARSKFPPNILCKTSHAFAFQALKVGAVFDAKLRQRMTLRVCAELLTIPFSGMNGRPRSACAAAILATVASFTYSADSEIDIQHIPCRYLDSIQSEDVRMTFAGWILHRARDLWRMIIDPRSPAPMRHDDYLKLWALSDPRLPGDLLLFDECQDANPVTLSIVQKQPHQKIYVGDSFQQLYSFRGAVDALDKIEARRLYLTRSFRFGPAIADVANKVLRLSGKPFPPLHGNDNRNSRIGLVTMPYTLICRTNAELFSQAVGYIEQGKLVSVVGGVRSITKTLEAAYALKNHATSVFDPVMSAFKDWDELCAAAEDDTELNLIKRLVEKNGDDLPDMCATLNEGASADDRQPDVVLTTAHKSKGREWSRVKLANDFPDKDKVAEHKESINVLYVAATRALNVLEPNNTLVDVLDPPF